MVILHLSRVPDDKCNGVVAVVPQHVAAQGKFADTALINLNGIALTGCERQILCGLESGRMICVLDGLTEGQQVITNY